MAACPRIQSAHIAEEIRGFDRQFMDMMGSTMEGSSSPRPLSIKLIAILHLITPLGFFSRPSEAIIFGIYITGQLAFFYTLLLDVSMFLVGLGLWRLRERARQIAIGLLLWGLLNVVLHFFVPATRTKMEVVAKQQGLDPAMVGPLFIGTLVGTAIFISLQLWFLMNRKSAFVKPTTLPPT